MSLRKLPVRTPAFLAAHRSNAQKCTGPRTPAGKAHSSLNPGGRDGEESRKSLVLRAGFLASPRTVRYRASLGMTAPRGIFRQPVGVSTVILEVRSSFPIWPGGESCAEKKMLKMRFKATMLLKTNKNAFGTKPFLGFKAKSCGGFCNCYAVENKQKCFWNEAPF